MYYSKLKLILLSSIFYSLVLLLSHSKAIVSGSSLVPNIDSAAYQISLQRYGSHFCSGAFISSEWVLTSARCTNQLDSSNLQIRAGSLNRTSGGVVIKLSKIVQHPEYDSNAFDYDFSLLQLANWTSDSITYKTVKLPEKLADIKDGVDLVVTGWGSVFNTSYNLLYADSVVEVNREECNKTYSELESEVTDRMICAAHREGSNDACQRDTGSPLMSNEIILGISSWGYGCTIREYPDVYSRVPSVRDWIKSVTGL